MRLGKLTTQAFNCTVLVKSACEECPPEHMGLPLYEEAVRPAGEEFHDWDSCMTNASSSSSVFNLPDWWVDVRLKSEGPTNWVCVKHINGFQDSSSSSSSEDQECECIMYGDFNPTVHQICGGPYPTEQYCSSMRCGIIDRNTSLLLKFNRVVPQDEHFSDVSLLLNFDGSFDDSGPKGIQVQPDPIYPASLSTERKDFGESSANFVPGYGYLFVNGGSELNFGSEDFTVEAWLYVRNTAVESKFLYMVYFSTQWFFGFKGQQGLGFGRDLTWEVISNSPPPARRWVHVAVTRSGNTLRTFVDGVVSATSSTSSSFGTNSGSNLYIGSGSFDGKMDELRITKGIARYISDYQVPSKSFPESSDPPNGDPHFNDVSLLLNMDGPDGGTTFLDSGPLKRTVQNPQTYWYGSYVRILKRSVRGKYGRDSAYLEGTAFYADTSPELAFGTGDFTIEAWVYLTGNPGTGVLYDGLHLNAINLTPNGNASISTAHSRWGTSSAYFDGVGDDIEISAASDVLIGRTGDFTIECWVRPVSLRPEGQAIFGNRPNGYALTDNCILLGLDGVGRPFIHTNATQMVNSATAIATEEWSHLAAVRQGNTFSLYVNGLSVGSWEGNYVLNSPINFRVGSDSRGWFAPLHGHIDDLRVTKGVARYTSGFPVPAAAFPADSSDPHFDSVSLLLRMDGSEGSTAFKNSSPVGTGGRTDCFAWELLRDGTTSAIHYDGQPHLFNNNAPVPTNVWTHQAIARKDGVLYRYSDGSLVGWQPFTLDITQGNCVVGRFSDQYSGTLNCYIDNYRITKGVARYAPEFTPADEPFPDPHYGTSSSSSFSVDPYLSKVWALTHFEASEGSTSFSDDSPNSRTISADGYGYGTPIVASTAVKRFGSSSAFFPPNTGNSYRFVEVEFPQWLYGDFTVECWFRPTTYNGGAGGHQSIFSSQYMYRYGVAMNSSGLLKLWVGNTYDSWSVAAGLAGQNPVSLNAWNHIALVRSGSIVSVYLNGQAEIQVDLGTASPISSYNLRIGYWPDGTMPINNGYIDEFRATLGLARYTSPFQPADSPFPTSMDPNGDTLVLLHMEGQEGSSKFVDSGPLTLSPYPYSSYNIYTGVYNADTRISTVRSKVGSASGRFSRSVPWVEPRLDMGYDNRDLSLGADFTIECWLRLEDNLYNSNVADTGYSGWSFTLNGSAGYGLGFGRQYGGPPPLVDQSGRAPLGRWFHAAVTRERGTLRLFMDGAKVAERHDAFAYTVPDTGSLKVSVIQGNMDEFRIKRGKADYTSDFEPVPIRHEGPGYADVLLLHFDESSIVDSTGSHSPTPVGGVSTSTDNKRFGHSSLRFQSLGQRLDFGPSHSFDLETSDHTIECFLYITEWTGSGSSHPIVWTFEYGNYWIGSSTALTVLNDGSGRLSLVPLGGSPLITTPNNTISLNTWHHVALVKKESTAVLYVDGMPKGSTSEQVFFKARNQLSIGGSTIRFPYSNLRGYIDEFRITKNLGRYGAEFDFESDKYLIVDSSGNNTKITSYGAEVASDRSRYGSYSCYLKGGGAHLVAEGDSIPLGTDDFTLEFWIRPEEFPTYVIVSTGRGVGDDSGFGFTIERSNPEGGIRMIDDDGNIIVSRSQAISKGEWTHLAFTRKSSVVKLFVDGQELEQGICLGNFTSRFMSIGRNDFSPEGTFRGHIDDFRLVKGIAIYDAEFFPPQYESENYYGGLSRESFCIPLSIYDEVLHQICAGPHYSQADCGQCNPPSSSSSSGAAPCSPNVTVVTLPDGSSSFEFDCGGATPPGSSSSESCLSDPPGPHDIYCPDGTKIGQTFFLPNIDSCSWSPFEYKTGVCPEISSSSSSVDCQEQSRYCLYSDYPSKISFSMLNKPPPCDKYEHYCLPTGCSLACENPDYTSVAGCGVNSNDCCSPGVCFYKCELSGLMGECITCGLTTLNQGVWFQFGIGAQQYLDEICRLECWECLDSSKTCQSTAFLALELVEFGKMFGVDPLDVTCSMIAQPLGKTYYTRAIECNNNCGCCCVNNTTTTISNKTDCERGSPPGDWFFGEICPMSWNCDSSVGPKEVCDKSGEFPTEVAVREACREVWFCSVDGPAKTDQWSTTGPFEEKVRQECIYTFDCESSGCKGYWRDNNHGPFADQASCENDCNKIYYCDSSVGCAFIYWNLSNGEPPFQPYWGSLAECESACNKIYYCDSSVGCTFIYWNLSNGEPPFQPYWGSLVECESACKQIFYCDYYNGCTFSGWDITGDTKSECESGPNCKEIVYCDPSYGCVRTHYGPDGPEVQTREECEADPNCQRRFECTDFGCKFKEYGPTGYTQSECFSDCPVKCINEYFFTSGVPYGDCQRVPYGTRTVNMPQGFTPPVRVTITGSSDDDFLVNGNQVVPGACNGAGYFPTYTFVLNSTSFTIAAGDNFGVNASYDVNICFEACDSACGSGQVLDSACKCVCEPGKEQCGDDCYEPCQTYAYRNPESCKCECQFDKVECEGNCLDPCQGGKAYDSGCSNCSCPYGTEECGGYCVSPCSADKILDSNECLCKCPANTVECEGNCLSPCPDGKVYDFNCNCVCPYGESICEGTCQDDCLYARCSIQGVTNEFLENHSDSFYSNTRSAFVPSFSSGLAAAGVQWKDGYPGALGGCPYFFWEDLVTNWGFLVGPSFAPCRVLKSRMRLFVVNCDTAIVTERTSDAIQPSETSNYDNNMEFFSCDNCDSLGGTCGADIPSYANDPSVLCP